MGKADLLPLLWGGRSCVSIANNRFGEGVHPVRVNTCHCEGGKCNGLVSQPIRHCEVCEARRGNPVEQRLNLLDCFTTFAMTVIRHSEGVFYPTYQLVLTLPIEVHLPLRRVSLLMLRGFFAPLCSALNDKTVTNFSTVQL